MAYSTRYYNRGPSYSGWFPPGVKWLLIANIAIFVFTYFSYHVLRGPDVAEWFGLVPVKVIPGMQIWRVVTYMFLHDVRGFGHILFNMLALWMFGKDIEATWGTRRFLNFYFLCGLVAAGCVIVLNYLTGTAGTNTIGASGAIYGLLAAFGMLFPDVTVLFSFLFPIKAKYFVMIIGAITFLSSFQANTGVSNFAHLGGLVFGYLYLRSTMNRRSGVSSRFRSETAFERLRSRYKQWQIERAKRKFEVYLKKNGQKGPWMN
jgi:membrane associated rhomboid family serine protease